MNALSEHYHVFLCFVCMFLWGLSIHSRLLTHIWRRHHYRWRAANFDLCSALMAIEQWGFLSVPHLLWYGTSVYDGHLRARGPMTPKSLAERLAVELWLPFLRLRSMVTTRFLPKTSKTFYSIRPRQYILQTLVCVVADYYRHVCTVKTLPRRWYML